MQSKQPLAIAVLDVLGFGSVFRRFGLRRTVTLYKKLVGFVSQQKGGLSVVPVPSGAEEATLAVGWFLPEHTYFSDTVLFWTQYNPISFYLLTTLASEAVCQALELGLPLRGAICIGEAVLDNNQRVYVGEPLIEAAVTEKAQLWMGVSFGSSINLSPFNSNIYLASVLPFKSHIKPGHEHAVPGLVVDWPRHWRESRKRDVVKALQKLDVTPEFAEYYNNTKRFIEFSQQHHDWFKFDRHLDFG